MREFLHLLNATVIVLALPAFIGLVLFAGNRAMRSFEEGQLNRSSRRVQALHEQMRLREIEERTEQ